MKIGKYAQSMQYLCMCEPPRIEGCFSNETRARLTIILKVQEDLSSRSKPSLLEKLCLNLIENHNFHMIIRTIYAKF